MRQHAEAAEIPLSMVQQRIWAHERLEPDLALYGIPLAWRRRGRLDPDRLRAALSEMTARHEVLRTRFTDRDGRLVQVIGDAAWQPEVARADFRGLPPGESDRRLQKLLRDAGHRRFDAGSGRLMRAGLIDLDDDEQVLFLQVHHLAWDIAPEAVFFRDLDAAYTLPAAGAVSEHLATPHQERMGFTARFETGTVYAGPPSYHNLPLLLRLSNRPRPEVLREALAEIVRRHPSLRANIAFAGGRYVQQVASAASERVDLTVLPAGDAGPGQPAPVTEELHRWRRQGFELASEPLFRVAIQPLPGGGCWLALVAHLAVADRASLGLVAAELARQLTGQPLDAQLPDAQVPGSFTDWWESRDRNQVAIDLEVLAAQAGGDAEPLRLPELTARAAVHVYREASVPLVIPPE